MPKRIVSRKSSGKKIVIRIKGNSIGTQCETKEARIKRRLKAFRSLVGLWEGKDTSFFDNR
ncbi:hypothetical protein SAMN05660649_01480 [Desulfotomaculum arcticum]|uniref:Uncharacterized protein n=1 Tax=Desulfotruncus arcticus DSM 17038 TaxID=1121424 RepID=A0A1I2RIW7_9FIRM|nr:hypothetical protein SAMN05660649_01480 [Desulfotomaculum arcticum] [Desulfotruncus arcticus DSM 17038]